MQSFEENPFQYIEIAGNRIRYLCQGEGEPVVLVHGSCHSLYTWRNNLAELAKHFKVYALDLPGFGFSDKPPIDYTPMMFADTLSLFIDRLRLGAVHLIGSSIGGSICGLVTLDYPERVRTLTMIDPRVYPPAPKSPINRMIALPILGRVLLKTFNNRTATALTLREYYYDKTQVDNSLIDHYYEPLTTRGSNWSVHSLMRNCDYSEILGARTHLINRPTLIIWGEHDHLFPLSDGQQLHAEIPNSRLTVIPKAGHLPHEEQAEVVNDLLVKFLKGHLEQDERVA